MASFSTGLEELPQPVLEAPGKPRAKLSHLRNYRFCEELDIDKRGRPGRVVVKGMTRMVWKRCPGSEDWFELESEG